MKKFLTKLVVFAIISSFVSIMGIAHAGYTKEDQEKCQTDHGMTCEEHEDEVKLEKEINAMEVAVTGASAAAIAQFADPFKIDGKTDKECVRPSEKEGVSVDSGYMITFIEEPIIQPTGGEKDKYGRTCYTQGDNKDFKVCSCYRNTFIWKAKNDSPPKTVAEVLVECSKSGQELAEQYATSKHRTAFYCQEIQVLFSKGGTTLISGYIGMIYRWAASIVGLIAVLVIVLSGIQLAASGGDSSAVEDAKRRIVQSIAGLMVLFLSGIILYTINPNFFVK